MKDASQITLLATLVVTQLALWGAYAVQLPTFGGDHLWGRIDGPWRTYFLATAAVAYLCHLGVGGYLVAEGRPWQRYAFAGGALAYYVLQLFFLPLLAREAKTPVRALLGACVLPMAVCTAAGVGLALERGGGAGAAVGVAATLPLLHVAGNDFALFAFRF